MGLVPPVTGFPSSPAIQAGGAVADAITESPKERQKKALAGKYKGVAQYLKIIDRTARSEGIPPEFQAAITAVEHTGTSGALNWKEWNPRAKSPVGAQGIAQFMPGTWNGEWNPWRNRSPFDPGVALQAQARFLKRLLSQHKGNASEAAQSYNGGSYRGAETQAYAGQMRRALNELKDDGVFGSGGTRLQLPGLDEVAAGLNAVDDAAGAVAQLVGTFLSPRKMGELWANITTFFLRLFFKSLWKYMFAPLWHWHQRAVVYYYREIMADRAGSSFYYRSAAFTTTGFWAMGYAILWARADGDGNRFLAKATDTPLASFVKSTRSSTARRKLHKPADVEKETPTKPKPVKSSAQLDQVDTISVHRNRPVTVRKGSTTNERNA